MTLFFLCVLTLMAAVWPMAPALAEWYRPTDTQSLQIETADTLDPPALARSFSDRLSNALLAGKTHLGRSELAHADSSVCWPLTSLEKSSGSTLRVWHSSADIQMPIGVKFLAEVATETNLSTAKGGTYRSLFAGDQLMLSPMSHLTRWAHAKQVEVGTGCRLGGRLTATNRITVGGDVEFTLLHAPLIQFIPICPGKVDIAPHVTTISLPKIVIWNVAAAIGTCDFPLEIKGYSAWRGDLVCHSSVQIGPGCNVRGSVKARGDLRVGAGCIITGSLVSDGTVTLEAGTRIGGIVLSEREIVLGRGCVIGAQDQPATVAAPCIQVAPGVQVHGTVWATQGGCTQADEFPDSVLVLDEPNLRDRSIREAAV